MKIARVFPHKKSVFTPTDEDCYFDVPKYNTPHYDEVHVSCVFTWDKPQAQFLAWQWRDYGDKVLIGGPAYGSPCEDFVPGRYVAPGVIFTSRGCPNKCKFCHVPKKEGAFRELPVVPGHIIQDNNILACSDAHWDKLISMLRTQSRIEFKGGLEARRLTDKRILDIRSLSIASLWLACDTPGSFPVVKNAIDRLTKAGFTRSHIYVYVICGEDEEEEAARMEKIFLAGGIPFAQLFQPEEKIEYSPEWKKFSKFWSRPASIKSAMKSLFSENEDLL